MDPKYTYEEFEECMLEAQGMKIIYGQDEPGVKFYPDTEYADKDGKKLIVKIMSPLCLNEKKKYPLLVHIQGSAWFKQNLNCNIGNYMDIVKAGYIVAIVEYRFAPEHRFPDQIEDGKTCVRFLMEHADEFNIDKNNVFLSGDSSGGHTAMMMMVTWDSMLCDEEKTPLPKLNACIDYYGSLNCLTMNDGPSAYDHDSEFSPASNYLGFVSKTNPEEAIRRSPFPYVNKETVLPPVLIMHGSKDRTVPFIQSYNFYKHLRSFGKDVTLYKVKNGDHGGNVFYCEATKKVIVDFLNEHLR